MAKKTLKDVQKSMTGTGVYLMENTTSGDIGLPKPSMEGFILIRPGQRFRGDSYLFNAMRGQVRLLEDMSMRYKVLTEQPPTVTKDGLTENEVDQNKNESSEDNKEILLCEVPLDSITILD